MQNDKYIKFRISFYKGDGSGKLPDADKFAKEILAKVEVPSESPYMQALREDYQKQQIKLLMQLQQEAIEKDDK